MRTTIVVDISERRTWRGLCDGGIRDGRVWLAHAV